MNDYMIRLDENGQPYIAHAGFLQRAGSAISNAGTKVRNNVKYIMKVGDPKKPRYLYTQQEVDAYLKGGRQQLTNQPKVQTQTGTKAVKNQNALKQLQRRAEDKIDSAKQTGRKALTNAERVWEDTVKPTTSTAEKNMREAKRVYEDARDTMKDLGNEASKKANRAVEDLGDMAKQAGREVKSKTDRMREEFRKKKDEAVEKVKDTADKAKDAVNKAGDKVKDWAGVDERERRDAAKKDYEVSERVGNRLADTGTKKISESIYEKDESKKDKLFDEGIKLRNKGWEMADKARDEYYEAEKDYGKTLLGKAENAKNKVKKAADDVSLDAELAAWEAGKKIKGAANAVKDFVADKAWAVESAADRIKENITGEEVKKLQARAEKNAREARKDAYNTKNPLEREIALNYEKKWNQIADRYNRVYNDTLKGRLEDTGRDIKNTVDDLKDKVEDAKEERRIKKTVKRNMKESSGR